MSATDECREPKQRELWLRMPGHRVDQRDPKVQGSGKAGACQAQPWTKQRNAAATSVGEDPLQPFDHIRLATHANSSLGRTQRAIRPIAASASGATPARK